MAEPNGARMIAFERARQIKEEGWTPKHDDEHDDEALAAAAAFLAAPTTAPVQHIDTSRDRDDPRPPHVWRKTVTWPGWDVIEKDRIDALVKAGALIAAEIDRLQRAATTGEKT